MNITNAKNRLLSEIKVNPVSRGFEVTDKGKKYIEYYDKFTDLANIFDMQDDIFDSESEIFHKTEQLFMFSDKYGEKIIFINEANKLEYYINRYRDIWGGDIEEAKKYLKLFMEFNFITNINI
jgi:hypothetical protein